LFSTAERSEEASKALAAKREYKSRIEQISRDFEEEQKQTFEITQDMTRQYKGMQEELLTRVRYVQFIDYARIVLKAVPDCASR
jgi:hypothetical protein